MIGAIYLSGKKIGKEGRRGKKEKRKKINKNH